jgi:hypothetical protein
MQLVEKVMVDNVDASYRLTRWVLLRLLGLVYGVAFLVAVNQVIPLVGDHGLLPAKLFLARIDAGFFRLPTIFWWWHSDTALLTVAWTGLVLSCMVAAGYANKIIMGLLWFLYLSIVNIGQDWWGYGWEIQLCETGFLAIFLCPLIQIHPFPKEKPPVLVIYLFRWLACRIMLGAGLIKIRGDETWRNGTALYTFFETQPIPGPLSRWFHFLPHTVLKIGIWFNWVAELLAPLFVFGPRLARHIAGAVIIVFQLSIVVSGNLSFLNWLTIIPAIACFDDGFWTRILPASLVRKAAASADPEAEPGHEPITAIILATVIGLLSIAPVMNMLSPGQVMNTSFDPFNLVNTYGAFGSVGRERYQLVFEGTMDNNPENARWVPYPLKGLPGDPDRVPPQIAPYQLRLDWQLWFAAMGRPEDYPWAFNLVWKLLHNDGQTLGLFAGNPFPGKPPRFIRAVLYRYSFSADNKHFWTREKLGNWLPPMSVNDKPLANYVKEMGW